MCNCYIIFIIIKTVNELPNLLVNGSLTDSTLLINGNSYFKLLPFILFPPFIFYFLIIFILKFGKGINFFLIFKKIFLKKKN